MEKTEIKFLLESPLLELVAHTNKIRRDSATDGIELCSIINAKSGLCDEDCKFCAQSSRHKTDMPVYPLKEKEQIVEAAREAKRIGAKKFGIVTSGNRLKANELDTIARAVFEIKNEIKIDLCCSLGALEKSELKTLKEAGISRYHHNIETSPRFYPQIVSTHTFEQRVDTIKAAKEVGLEVCSGGIIGMGENWYDRIDMAELLKKLNVDSVPINFLVPIKATAFEDMKPISCSDAIRTICIFRSVLPNKAIKIAAGRETILKDFQALGFAAGANGMLIGGYLTIKGRDVAEDHRLIAEVEKLWNA